MCSDDKGSSPDANALRAACGDVVSATYHPSGVGCGCAVLALSSSTPPAEYPPGSKPSSTTHHHRLRRDVPAPQKPKEPDDEFHERYLEGYRGDFGVAVSVVPQTHSNVAPPALSLGPEMALDNVHQRPVTPLLRVASRTKCLFLLLRDHPRHGVLLAFNMRILYILYPTPFNKGRQTQSPSRSPLPRVACSIRLYLRCPRRQIKWCRTYSNHRVR